MSFATGTWLDLRSTGGSWTRGRAGLRINQAHEQQDAARRGLPNLQPRVIPARHMACSCDVEFPPPTPHSLRWRQVTLIGRPPSCVIYTRMGQEEIVEDSQVCEKYDGIQYRRNESIFNVRQARQLPKRYCAFTALVTHVVTTRP